MPRASPAVGATCAGSASTACTSRSASSDRPSRTASQPATDAIRAAAVAIAPFDVSIGGAGAFPSPGRPRALWLGIRTGTEELVELARVVDAELTTAGWTFEPRPLSPHLTLARSDGVPAGAAIGQRLVAVAADLDIRFRADRIGLFESLTGGGPARYEPLELAPAGRVGARRAGFVNAVLPSRPRGRLG